VRRFSFALVLLIAACGDLQSDQAAGPASASPSATSSSAATGDCVGLAKITPTTVPPLIVTDLGDGTKRVTSAEGGYTLVAPTGWIVTASSAGGSEPRFAQAHFSSFDARTAPSPRPEAGGMLPPEVGIHLDLELWWNPDRLGPDRYAPNVRIGPDQVAILPGSTVSVGGVTAYHFTIQDERRYQPSSAPLITVRQTRAVWLVPSLRDDRMLVIAATPAESDLLPAVEQAVSTLRLGGPPMSNVRPVTFQRSDIFKQWLLDKSGNVIPGRRVEAKLMTYADASAALSAPHTADQKGPSGGGPGSRLIPRMDHDPDALYWVVVVSGPDLPQGRGGPGGPPPAPTAWIFYDTPATTDSGSGTGAQYAAAGPSTPAWPLGFDILPDLCR